MAQDEHSWDALEVALLGDQERLNEAQEQRTADQTQLLAPDSASDPASPIPCTRWRPSGGLDRFDASHSDAGVSSGWLQVCGGALAGLCGKPAGDLQTYKSLLLPLPLLLLLLLTQQVLSCMLSPMLPGS